MSPPLPFTSYYYYIIIFLKCLGMEAWPWKWHKRSHQNSPFSPFTLIYNDTVIIVFSYLCN